MISFNAAVLVECGKPLEIIKVNNPSLKSGQVLVKLFKSAICGSQMMEIDGGRSNKKYLPHMLGHEGVGIVTDVAFDVKKVASGDKVVLTWIKCLGIDAGPTSYESEIGQINSGPVTTFSEYTIASENRMFKIDNSVSFGISPLLGCAIPTGCGLVFNEVQPLKKDSIGILGLGGIGFSALLALRALKISDVTVFDVDEEKLELARQLGVIKCVNLREVDPQKYANKFDKVIEAAGSTHTIEIGFSLIKSSGKLVFASHPPKGHQISLDPHELISGKKIKGSWGGGCNPEEDLSKLLKVFSDESEVIKKVTSTTYAFEEINNAISDFKARKCFRPIINFE